MAYQGGVDENVSSHGHNQSSFSTADAHVCVTTCYAQNLVRSCVKVIVVVDPIPPRRIPCVGRKQDFKRRSGIEISNDLNGCTVIDERKSRIIRCIAIIQKKGLRAVSVRAELRVSGAECR